MLTGEKEKGRNAHAEGRGTSVGIVQEKKIHVKDYSIMKGKRRQGKAKAEKKSEKGKKE